MNKSIHISLLLRRKTRSNGLNLSKTQIRTLVLMKLNILLLLVLSLQVSAKVYSQQVSLSVRNTPLEEVLEELSKQSGYSFLYDEVYLSQAKPLTLKATKVEILKVLPWVFADQPFLYKINEKIITLVPKFNVKPNETETKQDSVRGKITDSLGRPLLGVTIRIESTNITTNSDENGEFRLKFVPKGVNIRFSYIGYAPENRIYDGLKTLKTVILKPLSSKLDETVVIAYGQTTKRLNTGSVGKVTAAEIARQPVANPIAALQGRIPGVEITQQSGRTGSNFNILIRGQSSIANGNEPLYIIDGVPWLSTSLSQIAGSAGSQSPFNSINPQDVQSIEVLKDADATAIYGSRGANGVILITTKKGSIGRTTVDLNAYTGFSKVGHTMPLMNTEQYLAMRKEALANDGITPTNTNAPDLLLYNQERFTDWMQVLIGNTASLTDIQAALSGGSINTQFRLTGGFRRETNVYPNKDADKRGSGQLNFTHRSENGKLRSSLTLNYSNDDNNLPSFDLTSGIYSAPNLKLYNEDGSFAWNENGSANRSNPIAQTLQTINSVTDNMVSNLSLGYSISKNFQVKVNTGYTYLQLEETKLFPLASYVPSASRTSGQSQFAKSRIRNWIIEPQISYNQSFDNHRIDVLLGASWQKEETIGTTINASNYSNEALLHTSAGAGTISTSELYSLYKYQSVFGRINYQFKKRYLLNLTARRDGSSRFGPGQRFANFGAIGGAWIFTEEPFIKDDVSFLSFGKIRASFGLTGNDKIGNYQFMDTYGSVKYPYGGVSGLVAQRLFNAVYKWESNRKLEFALDLGFLKDRILLSGGWFRNRSGNQLLQYSLPSQTGFTGVIRNLPALVENVGFEFEVNTLNIQNKNLTWKTSFNLTRAENKLLEFPNLKASSYSNKYEIGHSLNIAKAYPYNGIDQKTGLWSADVNAGQSAITNLTPKFYGGFNNSIEYKGFELNIFFQFIKKTGRNFIYTLPALAGGMNYNMPVIFEDRWQSQNEETDIQRFGTTGIASSSRTNYLLSNGVMTDASFIRLKNASLSYSIPSNWVNRFNIQRFRIYLQGQNLLTFTGYEGNDPEVNSMVVLPPLRTVTLGFQLTI
ncbi:MULTISPECIES: SusC/RagA family TonB-linked outer membrane protein [Olivibacter]|uniref:SusC/RagA family TonB-linked outer membrane protein n=1 Tax=Olivibacter oleidegradans TaxID=760123 RepID=A0ABV6HIG9_9SPHI|nr:SusC/RagA family TonB-linked outer membrane protein [Olivibacter jilunii]